MNKNYGIKQDEAAALAVVKIAVIITSNFYKLAEQEGRKVEIHPIYRVDGLFVGKLEGENCLRVARNDGVWQKSMVTVH